MHLIIIIIIIINNNNNNNNNNYQAVATPGVDFSSSMPLAPTRDLCTMTR